MKIFIDGRQADTDRRTEVSITLSVASQSQLETSRTGYSKSITLPATARNRRIMGPAGELNAVERFNDQPHTARIEKDGCTVIEGAPQLTETACGKEGYYRLTIVGAGREWVKHAADTSLRNLGIGFDDHLTAEMIRDSWTWDRPVRFLPVYRANLLPENPDDDIIPPLRQLTADDYHPFIHLGTIVRQTLAEAGYELHSEFMRGELFDSLYMSGNYPDVELDDGAMQVADNFVAGRKTTTGLVYGDSLGRVYATPYAVANTIGNIVDTVDPQDNPDLFANNGCFEKVDNHYEYRPSETMTMAFEYKLHYATNYRIISRTEMKTFDRVYLGNGEEYHFPIPMFEDVKESAVLGGKSFQFYVFGHISGNSYYISYTNRTTGVKTTRQVLYQNGNCVFPVGEIAIDLMEVKVYNSNAYATIPNAKYDWALFDRTFSETVDVELTIRGKLEEVGPDNPKTFHDIYFGGGQSNNYLILKNTSTIRPVSDYGPSESSHVDYPMLAAHDNVSCLDVIRALKHMFNLYFLTDQAARRVYIEPRSRFYAAEPTIDLSARIDFSRPITFADPAVDAARTMTFCYTGSDAAIAAFNRLNEHNLGVWSAHVGSRAAEQAERRYENPLFAPAVSSGAGYTAALDAKLVRVGSSGGAGRNFPPKVVRYLGMSTLPAGQTWGWPGNTQQYPLATFHDPDRSTTLAFEDRDGMTGIHTYWDGNIALMSAGQRVTLYVNLCPADIEPLVRVGDRGCDFRARYRLAIGGESAIFRLEEVADYNPAANLPAKCTFIKEY